MVDFLSAMNRQAPLTAKQFAGCEANAALLPAMLERPLSRELLAHA